MKKRKFTLSKFACRYEMDRMLPDSPENIRARKNFINECDDFMNKHGYRGLVVDTEHGLDLSNTNIEI